MSGTKTQTLRRRVARTVMCAETVQAGCSYRDPPFAELEILGIDLVSRRALSAADAAREGLPSLKALHEVLSGLYPDAADFTRVRFRVCARGPQRT